MKIAVIGCGNMGRTFVESFLNTHTISPADLLIIDHSTERCKILKEEGYKHVHDRVDSYLKQTDLIILAVKPQDAEGLYEELKTHIIPRHVVLSIMAGKTIASIQKALNVTKVVRAMPNLPCQIGMGMTAFTASPDVDRRSLIEVQNLINTAGKSIYFDDETQLDAVTALSGSGPAYIFYCMEAMISAGKKLGFTDAEAELLVQQTFVGSVHLKLRNELTPSQWISKVTSKGGTTEAALNVFSKRDLSGNITEGISAAFKRSRELGG